MDNPWEDITCVDACQSSAPTWGSVAIETDQDCCTIQELSQICGFYIDPSGQNPMASFASADIITWAAASVDNTDVTGTKVKYITVEGGIDAPTPIEESLPKGKTFISGYDYNADFVRRCISDEMNEFMRNMQLGNNDARIWPETLGGYLYGGMNGINPRKLYAFPTSGSGIDDKRTWTVHVEWRACTDPPRVLNPIA